MFQTCRMSWQDVTRSDKYSELSYVVFSWSCTLIPRRLRVRHHISAKNTFRTLCARTHKVRETRPTGSVRGVLGNGHPYRDSLTKIPGARNRHTGADLPVLGGGRLFGVPILH